MKHIHSDLCGNLSSQLPDYLDGEAREAICRAIEEHLAECEDCRIVIDTMKKTITLYREAPLETVPSDVHRRLVRVLNLDDIIEAK
ncbi:MAG: zf-HC2 domain-containing protein [Chloroflexi bacterium]|nr:zf-HC2 domain-containing protein [Chloroflexota bacterium]